MHARECYDCAVYSSATLRGTAVAPTPYGAVQTLEQLGVGNGLSAAMDLSPYAYAISSIEFAFRWPSCVSENASTTPVDTFSLLNSRQAVRLARSWMKLNVRSAPSSSVYSLRAASLTSFAAIMVERAKAQPSGIAKNTTRYTSSLFGRTITSASRPSALPLGRPLRRVAQSHLQPRPCARRLPGGMEIMPERKAIVWAGATGFQLSKPNGTECENCGRRKQTKESSSNASNSVRDILQPSVRPRSLGNCLQMDSASFSSP